MDTIKKAVAEEVQQMIHVHIVDSIIVELREKFDTLNISVSARNVSDYLTSIRVKPPKGGARHFIVRVSEQY